MGGTDERLARPRMTGTGIRTFGGASSLRLESLFGTDERLARPRMTGTVIRTFLSKYLLALLGVFSTSCWWKGGERLERGNGVLRLFQ